MSDLEPTADDYASVEHAGRLLHQQGLRRVFTPNEMTDAWAQLIDQIAEGYQLGVYEYTNDLSCRDWLAHAWPLFTQHVRAARQPALAALDERFQAATVDDGGAALSHYYRVERKDGWWWRRRPASWSASSPRTSGASASRSAKPTPGSDCLTPAQRKCGWSTKRPA